MKKLRLSNEHFEYLQKSFSEWLDILGYAPSTVYSLPLHLREFFYFLESLPIHNIKEVERKHFKAHFEALKQRSNTRQGGGLSGNYLNKHLQALYKFTDYLRQSGRLFLGNLNLAWQEDDTLEISFLTQHEIQQLYRATEGFNEGTILEPLNARDRAILTVFYACGLRRNEGFHLNVSDINFDRQLLHVRKGKNYKERFVPFNQTALKHLKEWVFDWRGFLVKNNLEEALFISQRGSRMQSQSMALRLKILQQRTEDIVLQQKNVHLHVLRHSIATHLLENGMPLEKISRFLGHTSLESTQIYTHLLEDSPREKKEKVVYKNIPLAFKTQLHEDE